MTATPRPAYEPKAWEEVACPFCRGERRRLYERFGWQLRFTLVECLECGLIYQSPRPVYDEHFLQAAYGGPVPDIPEELRRRCVAMFEPVVAEMLRFDRRRTALLDVGCHAGLFLRAAKGHWPITMGVEISDELRAQVEQELGVKVFGEPFETLVTPQRFSCIHMSHVIEHVPDPSAWIRKAHELLADEGVLVIAVPHIRALSERVKHALKKAGLRKGAWANAGKTPDHLFEPTIPAMLHFIERHGFDVVSHYTYTRWDQTSRKPFNRLYRRRLLLGSNARYYARRRPGS